MQRPDQHGTIEARDRGLARMGRARRVAATTATALVLGFGALAIQASSARHETRAVATGAATKSASTTASATKSSSTSPSGGTSSSGGATTSSGASGGTSSSAPTTTSQAPTVTSGGS